MNPNTHSYDYKAPPYEQSDDFYPTDEKRDMNPPDYLQINQALLHQFNFVVNELTFRHMSTLFVSQDAFEKYNSYKEVNTSSPYDTIGKVRDIQAQGIGIPLLSAEVGWGQSFNRSDMMLIYRYECPTGKQDFHRKLNRRLFCHVKVKSHVQYWSYELEFQESNKKIMLFLHRKYPIGDFYITGSDVRYRWLHTKYSLWNDLYRYDLDKLVPGQVSMLDGMDHRQNQLDPENPLVGRKSNTIFGFPERVASDFTGGISTGALERTKKHTSLHRHTVTKLSLDAPMTLPHADPESTLAVDECTLQLLCVGLVLHERENERRRNRRARNSGAAGC